MSDRTAPSRFDGVIRRRLVAVLRPIYDVLIRDAVREGRLRLDGTAPLARQLAIVGLLALGGLLLLLLVTNILREGDLIHLSVSGDRFTFVPASLVPITLLALLIGWWLLTWGAAFASPAVSVGVGVAFLLVHAVMSRITLVEFVAEERFHLGPFLVGVSYFVVPGILVVLALLRLRPAWWRRALPVALVALPVALLAFFGGHLWSHILQVSNRVPPQTPFTLESNLIAIQILLLPLLTITGVAIIEFGRGVASAATIHAWRSRAVVTRLLLLALVTVKLWIQLVRHAGDWATTLGTRPEVGFTTGLLLLALVAGALWARRVPRAGEDPDRAKEGLIYAAAVLLTLPGLVVNALSSTAEFLIQQVRAVGASQAIADLPLGHWASYADAALWLALLAIGVSLLRRRGGGGLAREVGVGFVLLGAWAATFFLLELASIEPATNLLLLDIMLTVAIGLFLVVRWTRVDTGTAVRLATVVLFSWLVFTEGDFVSIIGTLAGLPGTFVVVFGTLFVLLTDSSFAAKDSPRFPRSSRPLLLIGYLALSVTVVLWITATHATDITSNAGDRAFFYVIVPMAVWLLTRMPFTAPDDLEVDG